MSWSLSISSVQQDDFASHLKAAFERTKPQIEQSNPAGMDQAEAAVGMVCEIVDKGLVGSGLIYATLSGHGNPGHQPTKGWANDEIRIHLQCADTLPPPAPTAG